MYNYSHHRPHMALGGFTPAQWRVLDRCHAKRNLAEYEGNFDVDVQLLRELDDVAGQLEAAVDTLGPIKPRL